MIGYGSLSQSFCRSSEGTQGIQTIKPTCVDKRSIEGSMGLKCDEISWFNSLSSTKVVIKGKFYKGKTTEVLDPAGRLGLFEGRRAHRRYDHVGIVVGYKKDMMDFIIVGDRTIEP